MRFWAVTRSAALNHIPTLSSGGAILGPQWVGFPWDGGVLRLWIGTEPRRTGKVGAALALLKACRLNLQVT